MGCKVAQLDICKWLEMAVQENNNTQMKCRALCKLMCWRNTGRRGDRMEVSV